MQIMLDFGYTSSSIVLKDLIVPYSTCFRSLTQLFVDPFNLSTLFSLPFDSLVNLHLNLRYCGLRERVQLDDLLHAPLLRRLHVEGIKDLIVVHKIPYTQLTHISTRSLHAEQTLAKSQRSLKPNDGTLRGLGKHHRKISTRTADGSSGTFLETCIESE